MTDRMPWLDSIRFLACTWVFIHHFFDALNPIYLMLWEIKPFSYILSGFNVKLGVATFAVILGFLATRSGAQKKKSFLRYTVNRYIYFVVAEFLAGIIIMSFYRFADSDMWIMQSDLAIISNKEAVLQILKDALTLDCNIFVSFWFIKPFFYASVVCFSLGMFDVAIVPILAIDFIFYTTGQGWMAICLFGAVLFKVVDSDLLSNLLRNKNAKIAVLVVAVIIIKLFPKESALTYYFDGVACLLFLLVVYYSTTLKKLFTCSKLNFVLKNYMAFLILHLQIIHMVSALFKRECADCFLRPNIFFAIMVLCYVITVALSIPLDRFLNEIYAFGCRIIEKIPFEKQETKINISK